LPIIPIGINPTLTPAVGTNQLEEGYEKTQWYLISDVTPYDEDENKGRDAAASEVWGSVVWDMTQTYSNSASGRVRYWPGTVVDPKAGPAKERMAPNGEDAQETNILDYLRQDELVHYEDTRGMFSRGSRPAEGPKKVTPTGPYYSNPYAYVAGLSVEESHAAPGFPRFRLGKYLLFANGGWFEMRFRHEYYWESGTLFPVDAKGVELLEGMNYTKTRMLLPSSLAGLHFDDGAWVGWKDDIDNFGTSDGNYALKLTNINNVTINAFDTGFMPVAVGPRLTQPNGHALSLDMIFSMVLVNERRDAPV
jgi:hypothetical protein